jgi:hypothetical protein
MACSMVLNGNAVKVFLVFARLIQEILKKSHARRPIRLFLQKSGTDLFLET